jgi:NitT/TauT family transport system permease protein
MNEISKPRIPAVVWQILLGAIILLLWEWGVSSKVLDPFVFSRPSQIALRVSHLVFSGSIWPHLAVTFLEAALSFIIGGLLGVVSGFVLARSPLIASILEPYLRIGNALPRVVFAPIFLLWFGLGIWSKVALGVSVVFFVVFYNTFRGLREVDRVMIDNARNVRRIGASAPSTCTCSKRSHVDILQSACQHWARHHCCRRRRISGLISGYRLYDRAGRGCL